MDKQITINVRNTKHRKDKQIILMLKPQHEQIQCYYSYYQQMDKYYDINVKKTKNYNHRMKNILLLWKEVCFAEQRS